MVDENISTGLRNAIERGEDLEGAVQIMINSGYNPKKVKEASQFLSSGALTLQEQKPDEILLMPKKKGFFSNIFPKSNPKAIPNTNQIPIPKKDKITTDIENKLNQELRLKPINKNLNNNLNQNIKNLQKKPIPHYNKLNNEYFQDKDKIKYPTSSLQQPTPTNNQTSTIQQSPEIQKIMEPNPPISPNMNNDSLTSDLKEGKFSKELKKIKPIGKGYFKEIMLIVILLALIGLLAVTIIFKSTIIGWFS